MIKINIFRVVKKCAHQYISTQTFIPEASITSQNNGDNYNYNEHRTPSQFSPFPRNPKNHHRTRSLDSIDLDRSNTYPTGNILYNVDPNRDEDDIILTQTTVANTNNTQSSVYSTYIDLLESDGSTPESATPTQEENIREQQELTHSPTKDCQDVTVILEDVVIRRNTRLTKKLGNTTEQVSLTVPKEEANCIYIHNFL